jgi:RHH-type proline utilization regulon transcriptional repressor/proline dehydrogenase/delta 1-pyrroline-5-carboxylate dehydrogenase
MREDSASRTDRVLKLAATLGEYTHEPATADALAIRLGVSARTIYRDIELLRSNGYSVYGAPGTGFRLLSAPKPVTAAAPPHGSRFTAVFKDRPPPGGPLRHAVRATIRAPETPLVSMLAEEARLPPDQTEAVNRDAIRMVAQVRENRQNEGGIDRFMHEFALASEEGVALMCLAEALLRIPDTATQDALIEDKLLGPNWSAHLGKSEGLFVNASTLGLMISGRLLRLGSGQGLAATLGRLIHRSGEPVIRAAIRQAMRILGRQFVMGRTIKEALSRAKSEAPAYRMSFDMLGEAAYTDADACGYRDKYLHAIKAVGAARKSDQDVIDAHGVSVKLSALHPRYEFGQRDQTTGLLYERLLLMAEAAAAGGIGLCIDAEEAERLDLSLELFTRLAHEPGLKGWDGLGLAIQAYQRRARPLIDWLAELAQDSGRRLMTRLVKGAYWDAEIKRAQEDGLSDFPVFTHKAHTDISYLACAKALLAQPNAFYPCFATHNAHTVAAMRVMAGDQPFEFQRLHGMGAPLYEPLVEGAEDLVACRIYAPVGGHEDLLAYLVRRLLENGANSSFVNRIVDDNLPIEAVAADPIEAAAARGFSPHPRVTPPTGLFAPRKSSKGLDLTDPIATAELAETVTALEAGGETIAAMPITSADGPATPPMPITSPTQINALIGTVQQTSVPLAQAALGAASAAQRIWDQRGGETRASILRRAAALYEENAVRLMRICVREAGKTWKDAHAEFREAVDFLRYYADEAERLFSSETALPAPTGERNGLRLVGRGVFLCISPWNFPLAIFTGQVSAALAAGNSVLAKPAEQTPLVAFEAVKLLQQAGVPKSVLHLLPGDGPTIGDALLADARLAGVAFTGSTATAKLIARKLAEREGPITPLIAETGGINAMIVDSSALPEQATRDVIASAFQSTGQRCSAARVMYIQEEAAARQLAMIKGSMAALRVGDPGWLCTDVGPVIDAAARKALLTHCAKLDKPGRLQGRLIAQTPMPKDLPDGYWFAPRMYRIDAMADLAEETFGPILHVLTWKSGELDAVIDAINAAGYGLTLGLHSRVESVWRRVVERARVGNIYINRNQIGAIVGSQPFGGEGLSGTGPKAGGPNYLARFAVERVVSIDVTAQGGDADLMSLEM